MLTLKDAMDFISSNIAGSCDCQECSAARIVIAALKANSGEPPAPNRPIPSLAECQEAARASMDYSLSTGEEHLVGAVWAFIERRLRQ